MNLYYFTPFSPEKNLAKAYNDYMKLLPSGSWVCFTDYDAMFLDPSFDEKIRKHIQKRPKTGIFTCYTNRVGAKYQCFQGRIDTHGDMGHWRRIAKKLAVENDGKVTDLAREISGFCMVFSKETWMTVDGFAENSGCLGVDNAFAFDVLALGRRILRMDDVFCLHYYRLLEGIGFKQHLK